jgi:hypothetical protein
VGHPPLARILRVCGRPREAIPVLQEALQARHRPGVRLDRADVELGTLLTELYLEAGDFEQAVGAGLTTEAILLALPGGLQAAPRESMKLMATLADAFDGAGGAEECADYDERAVLMYVGCGVLVPQLFSGRRRTAWRLWQEGGEPARAEQSLETALKWYRDTVAGVGLGLASSCLRRRWAGRPRRGRSSKTWTRRRPSSTRSSERR